MSALGQKQTYAVQNVMSALPPIADICSAQADVRFVPIADIAKYLSAADCSEALHDCSSFFADSCQLETVACCSTEEQQLKKLWITLVCT
jgi:hypothetical protein